MHLGSKIIVLEMRGNGEFSVVDVYKNEQVFYNVTEDEVSEFNEGWGKDNYDDETFADWIAAFEGNDIENVSKRYDREHKVFVPVERKKLGIGTGTATVYRAGAYRGRVLDNAEGKDQEDDLSYQLRDPDQVSDRELLANVMDSAAETQAELDFVRRYRAQIQQLDEKQRDLEQTRQEIADARKNGARKSDIAVLENKAKILRNQIDRMDGKLLEFEAGKPLKAVVKRQRDDLRRKANERMQKRVAEVRQQEAAKRDEMRERISKLRDEKNARIEALKAYYSEGDIRGQYRPLITPHAMRHNFITMCWEQGLDILITMKLVGHSDYQTTRNIYTHLSQKHLDQAKKDLELMFAKNKKVAQKLHNDLKAE